jgi:hypothetical protein
MFDATGRGKEMVRKRGLEPLRISPPDPKSGASANSATFAWFSFNNLAHYRRSFVLLVADSVTSTFDEDTSFSAAAWEGSGARWAWRIVILNCTVPHPLSDSPDIHSGQYQAGCDHVSVAAPRVVRHLRLVHGRFKPVARRPERLVLDVEEYGAMTAAAEQVRPVGA